MASHIPPVNLKTVKRPEDFDGANPNIDSKAKVGDAAAPAFANFKLKKVDRPADYDGTAPNVNVKKGETGVSELYDANKLKKVATPLP